MGSSGPDWFHWSTASDLLAYVSFAPIARLCGKGTSAPSPAARTIDYAPDCAEAPIRNVVSLDTVRHRGVQAALLAAVLFGAGTPAAKLLLGGVSPWLLAGLLYCGSGVGLSLIRVARRSPRVRLSRDELAPLAGAIAFGGIAGPVLMMLGLTQLPASGASLLLNAESVFTALLAWFVFKENFDRRIALGMLAIVAGAILLSVQDGMGLGRAIPSLAVLGACLCWGLDNNLTRKVSLTDATWLAGVKGSIAGPVNLLLAFLVGAELPAVPNVAAALMVGFFAYGVSLVLYIVGMRQLGTARASAYFSIAPFFGAVLAVVLGDAITWPLIIAGLLMAGGVWLHLSEDHRHPHIHPELTHTHSHTADRHHQHEHPEPVLAGTWHTHEHTHEASIHTHQHYPDEHHRHSHG
jgi:drug/metabolite transporter (DMT)-like permease